MRSLDEVVVDVYSSPTYDVIGEQRFVGGPGYYIARALKRIRRLRAVLRLFGCGDPPPEYRLGLFDHISLQGKGRNVFVHSSDGGRRLLTLVDGCYGLPLHVDGGDVAIVAATYWDIPVNVACRVAQSYRTVIIDLQGYTRPLQGGKGRDLSASLKLLLDCLPSPPRVVVRGSIDDIPVEQIVSTTRFRLDVLTANGVLVVVRGRDYVTVLNLRGRLDSYAVGAGDMYDLFLGLALYYGLDIVEAAAAAHAMTVAVLQGGSLDVFEALRNPAALVSGVQVYPIDDLVTVVLKAYGEAMLQR